MREFSARLFQDSKRIEALTAQLDILLSGSIEEPKGCGPGLAGVGLFREEHPVLLAGHVHIVRDRSTGLIDAPYIGLPAATIQGVASKVTEVITVENKTTFHSEAKRRQDDLVLLIYTAGMPSPAWRAMYGRLLESLPPTTPIHHWGDVDEGGISNRLYDRGHGNRAVGFPEALPYVARGRALGNAGQGLSTNFGANSPLRLCRRMARARSDLSSRGRLCSWSRRKSLERS